MDAKEHASIAACGIDCGLCPLHYVRAGDGCPGCTAPTASGVKGRWCAIARCAVRDRGYETCADCPEFPCERLDGWDKRDSVVSHLKSLANLRAIGDRGLDGFLEEQRKRIALLETMLAEFDDGRSKGYCCLAATPAAVWTTLPQRWGSLARKPSVGESRTKTGSRERPFSVRTSTWWRSDSA